MICYFDTSAFVPLVVTEPATAACLELWDRADAVVSARIMYVEAAAALAQAERLRRIDPAGHEHALEQQDLLWDDIDLVEIDGPLCLRAAQLAKSCELRGYDAVHVAAIERIASDEVVAASGDKKLLEACRQIGIATAATHDRLGTVPSGRSGGSR